MENKNIPWNKGLKGYRHSGSFKKGHPDLTNGKTTGKNNWQWKGEKASYSVKHKWIVKKYGNPLQCCMCGKKGEYVIGKKGKRRWNIDWSNNSGKYKKNIKDWCGRCCSCHVKWDLKNHFRPWPVFKNNQYTIKKLNL